MRKTQLFLLILLYPLISTAQQNGNEKSVEESYRHRITVMMANSNIPNMDDVEGQNKFSIVPTWGIDYDYWFSKKWAINMMPN